MARIWVKGYTRSDGSKVEGHYRSLSTSPRRQKLIKGTASQLKHDLRRDRLGKPMPHNTDRTESRVLLARYLGKIKPSKNRWR